VTQINLRSKKEEMKASMITMEEDIE